MPHIDARFWNRMAKRYSNMQVPDPISYQEKLKRTRAVLHADAKVLEIGCGTGSTALEHAPHVAEIVAVDFSKKMIEIAKQKAKFARHKNVTFCVGALDDLPLEDDRFDVVLALNLVHLLRDPQQGIQQMAERLVPDGIMVLSTQCLADKMGWMRPFVPLFSSAGLFPAVQFFKQDELETWITDAGLTLQDSWRPKGPGKAVFHIARKQA